MGILSKHTNSSVITDEALLERGFEKSNWGSPSSWKQITVGSFATNDLFYKQKPEWNEDKMFWELILNDGMGVVYYFPKSFTGYVVPFKKSNIDTAGQIFIIEELTGDFTKIIKCVDVMDLDIAICELNNVLNNI